MTRNRIASVVTAGIAALLFAAAASSQVVVSLQTDGAPGELQVVATGLGGVGARDVSAFDLGITFDTSVFNLNSLDMNLNLAQLDDLNNLFGNGPGQYASCAIGSSGTPTEGGIGGCGTLPSGVQADLQFASFLLDPQLAVLQNGGAPSFSLTLATLDFTGSGDLSTIGLVWGDGIHDVKGDSSCLDATGVPGVACVIYNPSPLPPTPVPEPETFGLFGLGLVGALVARLLRRSNR